MRRFRPALTSPVVLALAALTAMTSLSPTGQAARRPAPALFQVGAAVRDISPPVPVYAGGYGLYAGATAITRTYAPLQVRAFYVSNGRTAVAMASVDSQAWFAAVQQGPWGISDAREAAAKKLGIASSSIIVQGTHSHSAPTVEGIWGPVPDRYLKLVHDQTVAALVAAARAARPAHLEVGSISSRDILDVTIADDTLAGWDVDGTISVLRATSPSTGATIASYVAVPAHPVTINGQERKVLGPDYFGPLRDDLEQLLGGTVVAGPATLGRQEPPVQTTDYTQLAFYAKALTGLVARAVASSRPVTDSTVSASETMLQVPASNAAILALAYSWAAQTAVGQAGVIYPADRAILPPYQTANVVGTPLTALRIGSTLVLSYPGEPYPEVVQAVRNAVSGADHVIALSKGQDDLGYFMPAWTYAFGVAEGTDHPLFSVAPQMGDQVAQAQGQLATAVGFTSTPLPASLPAPRPLQAVFSPGLQALAASAYGDAGPDGRYHPVLEAIYNQATFHGSPNKGGVRWDFGDGTHATTGYLLTATGPQGRSFVTHGFGVGRHKVTVTATAADGSTASWATEVVVFPRLSAAIGRSSSVGGLVSLHARAVGGDGHVLAARWFSHGRSIGTGTSISVRAGQVPTVTVRLVDGTGTAATTRAG